MLKLSGEEEITELKVRDYSFFIFPTGERKLTLTTHRVRYQRTESGSGAFKSIMLEDVAACMAEDDSKPVLLFVAALFFLFGLLMVPLSRQSDAAGLICVGLPVGMVNGLVFLLGYLLSRRHVLRIGSAGGTIDLVVQGRLGMREVREFIDELEAAKNDRYLCHRAVVATSGKPS